MESSALTRPPAGSRPLARLQSVPASRWAGLALFVLAAAVAVVYAIYPLIATYDALYALVWGREFWDGQALSFEAYRAPTEHPLSLRSASCSRRWASRPRG